MLGGFSAFLSSWMTLGGFAPSSWTAMLRSGGVLCDEAAVTTISLCGGFLFPV